MLDLSEDWTLAYDVWGVVIDAIDTIGIPAGIPCGDTLTYALTCFARITRRMGEYELSRVRYSRAIQLAQEYGLPKLTAMATIDDIAVQALMGDWKGAIAAFNREFEKAGELGWHDMQARAIISRGHAYYNTGRIDEALDDFVRGIQLDPETLDAEVAVGNIAACAAECGYFTIAKDAHRYVFKHARSHVARMGAAVNLIELAVWMNSRTDLDRVLEDIAPLTFDASMEVFRRLYILRAQVHFRIANAGISQLRELLAWARAHKIAPAVKIIQEDIARVRSGGPLVPPTPTPVDAPASLQALQRFWRQSGDL